jgi:hypothetical protein
MDMRTLRCWMNMDKSRSMDSKTSENQSYQNMFHSNIYQWDHLRCHATGAPAQMVRKATRVERTSAKGGIWSRRWPSKRHTPGEHRWKAGWKAGISCSSSQRWSFTVICPPYLEVIKCHVDFMLCLTCPQTLGSQGILHIFPLYGFV